MSKQLDAIQIKEWLDSIDSVIDSDSFDAAEELLIRTAQRLKERGGKNIISGSTTTEYVNTISVENQPCYPGDIDIEKRLAVYIRWNALAIVAKANKDSSELGGHISSFASSASLYEVGFNHFWRAPNSDLYGDMIFIQGHSSPGIYARSFIEGRLTEEQLLNFRQEANNKGISSYPHPWLMPNYWQFPTVSMGLGPLMAIFQARYMKYLGDRILINNDGRKVWCFVGDGETSEPETLGNIHIASREKLDNLIFVINCNLQRLDGPVNGNGKIIQELEGIFTGAGWKVIKCIWGKGWDQLLARDHNNKLKEIMMNTLDGEYQAYRSKDGKYIREKFFGKSPETLEMVKDLTDDDIWRLTRGGHDLEKIYAGYKEAVTNSEGKPVIILAKTIKGFGMGNEGESQNIAHNTKKLSIESLKKIRDKFNIPVNDKDIENIPFIVPQKDSIEYRYLHNQREKLGGYLPTREPMHIKLPILPLKSFEALLKSSDDKKLSTTMGFVRILNILAKDMQLGKYIIPIVPDESRTFGMEGMFRQFGIWSHVGQLYTPEDSSQLMFYKEDIKGQIFQEGINEPGAMSTWIAAATSYANHGLATIPFYIYYSMFGFQRIGDLAWAAGDMRARGFLIGGTAGRTTLSGEGLQHEDGHSHIQASLIPNCKSYDPTFNYELVVIVQHGMQEMYVENKDYFYYITVMNENYTHPEMPAGAEQGIINGAYLFKTIKAKSKLSVNLMGSGTIFRESIVAAEILAKEYNITVNLIATPSFNELYRNGVAALRYNMLHPSAKAKKPYLTELLETHNANLSVATTDYIRDYPNKVREFVPGKYVVLGTDGFGRSDYRAALRKFFEVDSSTIVVATLAGLAQQKLIETKVVTAALKKFNIDIDKINPWEA
ncbi:MAG: pyruvate dehydrogenase (acetyl-transferring), homodimeric type [Burkholderiales bacterium]|nr:pyruvate dehydrogenase (acetyl-transferring), homodimeric type [Burkholderiales bacterium]